MLDVSDSDIAAYRPLCRRLANKYNDVGGAEFDDLEQEGMIAVWQLLRRGFPVSVQAVENRMRDWVRVCRRMGFAYGEEPTFG